MNKTLKDAFGNPIYPSTKTECITDIYNNPINQLIRRPFIKGVNHRGWGGAPENTLPAYVESFQHGFKYVECDIAFTSDNVAVLLHDNTIDRTSNGSGTIQNMTFSTVRNYDFGSWKDSKYAGTKIPTFEEFIALCRNLGLHPYIEIKQNTNYTQEQLSQIVYYVEAYGMKGNVTYISFDSNYLSMIKNIDDKARLGYLTSNTVSSTIINTVNGLRTTYNDVYLGLDKNCVTDSVVSLCKQNHIPLEIWTVNSENEIKNIKSYISGVTSDYYNVETIVGSYSYKL